MITFFNISHFYRIRANGYSKDLSERYRLVVLPGKIMIIVLMAVLVVSLSGCCGSLPAPTTGDNQTQQPTVKATSAGQTTAGKTAVPALEWYATARAEAEGWNSDVFLYNIGGTNKEGSILPVDGKCQEWHYGFISPSAKVMHSVYVRNGAVYYTDNMSLANDETWNKIMGNANYRINSWAIDSPAATRTANEQYKKVNGSEPSVQVMYSLIQDYSPPDKFQLAWTITYDPSARLNDPNAPIIVYKIDANTGSVIG